MTNWRESPTSTQRAEGKIDRWMEDEQMGGWIPERGAGKFSPHHLRVQIASLVQHFF
jgi:hypothetical protein